MLVTREVFTQRCAYSRPKFFASNAVEFAYLAILKHMTSSGDPALHLMDALARSSREDTEYILSGIIRWWLGLVNTQIQAAEDFRLGNTGVSDVPQVKGLSVVARVGEFS